jgi:hypothetical protein
LVEQDKQNIQSSVIPAKAGTGIYKKIDTLFIENPIQQSIDWNSFDIDLSSI